MSGVELAYLKSNQSNLEVYTTHDPGNFDEALAEFTTYCERQLPVETQLKFLPKCFDISKNEETIVIGGLHGNLASFDIANRIVLRDDEVAPGTEITSVQIILDDTQVLALSSSNELYFLEYPGFELLYKLQLPPSKVTLMENQRKSLLYLSNNSEKLQVITLSKEDDFYSKKFSKRIITFDSAITAMKTSDDSSLLALGLQTGSISIVHTDTEKLLKATEACSATVTLISFSEAHHFLAAGFSDFTVKVWNLDVALAIKYTFTNHTDAITGLAFIRENKFLVASSLDTNISVWNIKAESSIYTMNINESKVNMMKMCKDFKTVYYIQDVDSLISWNVPQLPRNARYRGHSEKINAVLFVPFSFEAISLGDDGNLSIWDYRNDRKQDNIKLEGSLKCGLVNKSGHLAIIYSSKPCLFKVNMNNSRVDEVYLNSSVVCMSLSIDESMLALSDLQNRVKIFDMKTMDIVSVIKGHIFPVISCGFIENDNSIITASKDCTLGKWETMSGTRTHTFIGHETPLTSLLTNPEDLIISGSEDGIIIIWNYEGILQYTLTSLDQTPVVDLYLSENHTYLISLQDSRVTYWELNNLSVIFQLDTQYPAARFAVSSDEKHLLVAEGDTLYYEENAMGCANIRLVGRSIGSPHKFMKFIIDSQKETSKVMYDMAFNHWVVAPYLFGPAHILSYSNRFLDLNRGFFAQDIKANFFSTINNENPLSLCVEKEYKNCIDICLKYMKSLSLGKGGRAPNLRAYYPLESCLTQLNNIEYPYIAKLYEVLFFECDAVHLPRFSLHDTDLPNRYLSVHMIVLPEELVPRENFSSTGRPIVFSQSAFPLDLDIGTYKSIEFLESLLHCSDPEIFRSQLVNEFLQYKWIQVKPAVFALGLTYILYLILLALYIVLFIESKDFLMALTFVHMILWAYEILQIATDFSDYWNVVWNILDQLRSLSLTFYIIMAWQEEYNNDILLAVHIFSWARGIGNFRMFDNTRYMVRLIIQVILDIGTFFIMLFYSTLAFAFVFYLRDPESQPFPMFLTQAYRLDLGDFNTDLTEAFDWILFFISTMINPLIMLNLLIAIMSDTAAYVVEIDDICGLRELAEMIIDVEKVMFWKREMKHKHYLHKCDFIVAEESDDDKTMMKIKAIKRQAIKIGQSIKGIKKHVQRMAGSEVRDGVNLLMNEQKQLKEEMSENLKKNADLISNIRERLEID